MLIGRTLRQFNSIFILTKWQVVWYSSYMSWYRHRNISWTLIGFSPSNKKFYLPSCFPISLTLHRSIQWPSNYFLLYDQAKGFHFIQYCYRNQKNSMHSTIRNTAHLVKQKSWWSGIGSSDKVSFTKYISICKSHQPSHSGFSLCATPNNSSSLSLYSSCRSRTQFLEVFASIIHMDHWE